MNSSIDIVVCGSVDHGKSTLLGRLLLDTGSLAVEKLKELKKISSDHKKSFEPAFLIDSFREEREDEATIDISKVFVNYRNRRLCFIDTPGHLEFIKNMMTGATRAQNAVLIIDANEGIVSQTKRHFELLKMLGIVNIIFTINKMDKVDFGAERFFELKDEIKKVFEVIEDPILPVCAKNGDNVVVRGKRMRWFRGPSLMNAFLRSFKIKKEKGSLRLPLQDVYCQGRENICVGRIESGNLKAGQSARKWPRGENIRIISLKTLKGRRNIAFSKENVGVVLLGSDGKRGEMIYAPGIEPQISNSIKARVFWFSKTPFKKGESVILRCAAQETLAGLVEVNECRDPAAEEIFFDRQEIRQNELADIEIKTDVAVMFERFSKVDSLGRFIFENKEGACGAGIIL
ncbi:MAG TPA: GTP-binding protein [Candidatus Omnitrophota bacterium]|nr:GTP-binding protein [Candidatus Omnitrophota bacterium]